VQTLVCEEESEMAQVQLAANIRTERGKGAAHRLRRQGFIPAVLYGGVNGNIPLSVKFRDLHQIVVKGGWETILINLTFQQGEETKDVPVLIKDLQIDPVKRIPVHADFLEVTMGRVIQIHVPFELSGESPGVKLGGVLEFLTREIEVECLPSNILERVKVDISSLEIGDSLTVGDIALGEGYKILTDPGTGVVTITAPMKEEMVQEAVPEPAEPEVIQKGKKPEEGETAS
jgi:large subunit ribosomal protein L25